MFKEIIRFFVAASIGVLGGFCVFVMQLALNAYLTSNVHKYEQRNTVIQKDQSRIQTDYPNRWSK